MFTRRCCWRSTVVLGVLDYCKASPGGGFDPTSCSTNSDTQMIQKKPRILTRLNDFEYSGVQTGAQSITYSNGESWIGHSGIQCSLDPMRRLPHLDIFNMRIRMLFSSLIHCFLVSDATVARAHIETCFLGGLG